jgi:signal peptidase II
MDANKRKYVVFGVLAVIAFVLDQWTKVMARESLSDGKVVVVIEGFFNLRYSENPGVAFGMFQDLKGGRIILSVVALAAFALVIHYLRQTGPGQLRLHVALGLVGGGALGNVLDRVAYGKVTDFIVWYYKGFVWPAFNIADAALVVGVGLMILDMLRAPKVAAPDEAPAKKDA